MLTFADCAPQDALRLALEDGTEILGSHIMQAGMHFLHVRDGSIYGTVAGPFSPQQAVERTATRSEILRDRKARLRGAPFPGRAPETREDFAYRLELLARAIASETGDARRQELRYQFEDVADTICLATAKRTWLLAAGRFALTSNTPPTLRDLWFDDVASPSLIRRPRPRDFDPDRAERAKRDPAPPEVLAEPRSVPNMLSALRSRGLKAVIALAGDPVYDRARIQVDLAPGRLTRFDLDAERVGGVTSWRCRWAGNDSAAARRRHRAAVRSDAYALLIETVGGRTR